MKKRSDGGEEAQNYSQPKKKGASVFLYLLILFSIAFGLILFSFIVHQRDVENADRYRQEELLQRIADIESEYKGAENRIKELEREIDALSKRTEALELFNTMILLYNEGKTEECSVILGLLQKDDLYLSLPDTGKYDTEPPRSIYDALAAELSENGESVQNGSALND